MPFEVPIRIVGGPDITDWAETAVITLVRFEPGNFIVRHTKEGKRSDSWPGQHVDGWGNGRDDPGDIQWTLYIVIPDGRGGWVTGPCILYYPEEVPSLGVHRGHSGAPFSRGSADWWYQIAGMAGNQPGPGTAVGVIAVAGALRLLDVRQIHERSTIAWVTVPQNDTGEYKFDAPIPPVPESIPEPQVPNPPKQPPEPAPLPPGEPNAPKPPAGSEPTMTVLRAILSAFQSNGSELRKLNVKLDRIEKLIRGNK